MNFSSFSAFGTSANLNSTGSLARGMSARTTSGLYLRRIISSVIVSEKFAGKQRRKFNNKTHSPQICAAYVLCSGGNALPGASVSEPQTAGDEIEALSHLAALPGHDLGTWRWSPSVVHLRDSQSFAECSQAWPSCQNLHCLESPALPFPARTCRTSRCRWRASDCWRWRWQGRPRTPVRWSACSWCSLDMSSHDD